MGTGIDYVGDQIGFNRHRKFNCDTDSDADSKKSTLSWIVTLEPYMASNQA